MNQEVHSFHYDPEEVKQAIQEVERNKQEVIKVRKIKQLRRDIFLWKIAGPLSFVLLFFSPFLFIGLHKLMCLFITPDIANFVVILQGIICMLGFLSFHVCREENGLEHLKIKLRKLQNDD